MLHVSAIKTLNATTWTAHNENSTYLVPIAASHDGPTEKKEEARHRGNGRVDKEHHKKEDAFSKDFGVLKLPWI